MYDLQSLREEYQALESMPLAIAMDAYNIDGEQGRQDILSDIRREIELAEEEEEILNEEPYDLDALCPRYSTVHI